GSVAVAGLVGGGALAAIVAIVWALVTGGRAGPRKKLAGVTTRPAADGFWIDAPTKPRGTNVRWQCRVRGSPMSGIAELGGPSTFVYTGGAPEGLELLGATDPA